jgi:hypothetical protein
MVAHHSPDGTPEGFIRAVRQHPEGEVARAYRLWMASVLQPLNETAAKTITSHVDLLDSWRLEPALLALVAHVTSTRVMLQKRSGWARSLGASSGGRRSCWAYRRRSGRCRRSLRGWRQRLGRSLRGLGRRRRRRLWRRRRRARGCGCS